MSGEPNWLPENPEVKPCANCTWRYTVDEMAKLHYMYNNDRVPLAEPAHICPVCLESKEVQDKFQIEVARSGKIRRNYDWEAHKSFMRVLRHTHEAYIMGKKMSKPIEPKHITQSIVRKEIDGTKFDIGFVIMPKRKWVNKIILRYAIDGNPAIISKLKKAIDFYSKPLKHTHHIYGLKILKNAVLKGMPDIHSKEIEFHIISKPVEGDVAWCSKSANDFLGFFERIIKENIDEDKIKIFDMFIQSKELVA